MNKLLLLLPLICLCSLQAKAQNTDVTPDLDYAKYSGQIGKYAVTLFIAPDINDGEAGFYHYNDRPDTRFKLVVKEYETKYSDDASGMPRAWGIRYKLFEYTPRGNHTGTFDGILQNMGDGFSGTFTTTKGEKLKFELMRQYK